MHDSGLYCYFIIPAHNQCAKTWNVLSKQIPLTPGFLEFLAGFLVNFWITGARLNRASELMFNAWRTAALAVLFPPASEA